jgi:hypothetical protein
MTTHDRDMRFGGDIHNNKMERMNVEIRVIIAQIPLSENADEIVGESMGRNSGLYFCFFFFFTCLGFPILLSPIVQRNSPCLNVAGRKRITQHYHESEALERICTFLYRFTYPLRNEVENRR